MVVPPPLENLGDPLPNHKSTNIRMGKVRDALLVLPKRMRHALLISLPRWEEISLKEKSLPIH